MNREELKKLWYGRYVENDPGEFLALTEEIERLSPLKTVVEIGIKHCGTFVLWEQLIPPGEGLIIGVDYTPKEQILKYSGYSSVPPHIKPDKLTSEDQDWSWGAYPCDFIYPYNCTVGCYDPDKSDRQAHFVIGDSTALETREKVAEILNGRQVDFIFHDGEHYGDGPSKDFENLVLPFLRSGGLLVLTDTTCDGVEKLINRLGPVRFVGSRYNHFGSALWYKP